MSGRTTSRKAAISLVLAALSCCLWPFASMPALAVGVAGLILAVLGLWDICRSQGRMRGRRLAVTGLVVEAVAMLVFLLVVPAVEGVREAAGRTTSI
jgi:hypothetical protein